MHCFKVTLVAGAKTPYDTWTFVVIPQALAKELGTGPIPSRATIGGARRRSAVEGVLSGGRDRL